ncbi:MAG: hypothetical protein ABI456_00995 [Ktedonobacteraceae bacterium]
MMNSFPFADADVTPNPVSHLLGLWKVTDGANVGQGHPTKPPSQEQLFTARPMPSRSPC